MKKSVIGLLAAIMAFTMLFSVGCKKNESDATSERETLINGYETYADLVATSSRGELKGKISLNTEKEYVSQGNSSALFEIDCTDVKSYSTGALSTTACFKYETRDYPESLQWLDKIESFSMDVYNADDCDYELYFTAVGDEQYVYMTGGGTLVAKSWNYLRFEVKPWFFGEDTYVKEYCVYLRGISETFGKKARLYFDNFRSAAYDKNDEPLYKKEKGAVSNEILDFSSARDLDFIQTLNGKGSNGDTMPLYRISHSPDLDIGMFHGALKTVYDQTHKSGWVWTQSDEYVLSVSKSALREIKNFDNISVLCRNPEFESQRIKISASGNGQSIERTVDIGANQTVNIVLENTEEIETLESLSICIKCWNVTKPHTVYFAGLRFQ